MPRLGLCLSSSLNEGDVDLRDHYSTLGAAPRGSCSDPRLQIKFDPPSLPACELKPASTLNYHQLISSPPHQELCPPIPRPTCHLLAATLYGKPSALNSFP